jgi:hypothetical protein
VPLLCCGARRSTAFLPCFTVCLNRRSAVTPPDPPPPLLLHLAHVELGPFRFTLRRHDRLKEVSHRCCPPFPLRPFSPCMELDRHASTLPSTSHPRWRPDRRRPSPVFKAPLLSTPSCSEHHQTLPPFGDWWVPNLPLRSPVPQDPSPTAASHHRSSPSSEPRSLKLPPPPRRRSTATVSRSVHLLSQCHHRATHLLVGRTPHRHNHRCTVDERATAQPCA